MFILPEATKQIFKASSFFILPRRYAMAQLAEWPDATTDLFMVAKDDLEISAILPEASLPLVKVNQYESGYALFEVEISVPFQGVGFLATIATEVAKLELNILIESTFTRDCFMVKFEQAEIVAQALIQLGMQQTDGPKPR